MPNWPDDLSSCTLEEIFTSEIDNRAWYKELRLQNTALVNNRLAKTISQDEYVSTRRHTTEAAANVSAADQSSQRNYTPRRSLITISCSVRTLPAPCSFENDHALVGFSAFPCGALW